MRHVWVAAILAAGTLSGTMVAACALVEDLNGSEYTQVQLDGGIEASCNAKTNCTDLACRSAADCGDAGAVCAITAGIFSATTLSCLSPDQLKSSELAVQLCISSGECVNGQACSPQICSLTGADGGPSIGLAACALIPGCSPATQ